MLIVPIRMVTSLSILFWSKGKKQLSTQSKTEIARLTIVIISTTLLCKITNSSAIYHWIRG